jgi:hypothetical protein
MPCNDPLWSPKQRENGAPAKTFSYVPNWKLQFLVVLEFEYFDRMWKAHIYSPQLWPHPEKNLVGFKFEYCHSLPSTLGLTENYDFFWGSNLNTLWQNLKGTYFIFSFGPHQKYEFLVGFNLEYVWQKFKGTYFIFNLGPH